MSSVKWQRQKAEGGMRAEGVGSASIGHCLSRHRVCDAKKQFYESTEKFKSTVTKQSWGSAAEEI